MTVATATLSRATRLPWRVDRTAVTDALPLFAALAPFALLIGVAGSKSSDGAVAAWSGSVLLYGGSAQLSAMSLLDQSASMLTVVAAIALINARFLVYSATLASRFAQQPPWFRWGAAHFVVEPTFALTMARDDLDEPARFRRYWMTVSVVVLIGWSGFMAVGAAAGPVIPTVPAVTFLPTAALLTMFVPMMKERPSLIAAGSGAVAALVVPLPGAARVLVAVVIGTAVAALADRSGR
jgi:predicted branched-subunit amino acid permease